MKHLAENWYCNNESFYFGRGGEISTPTSLRNNSWVSHALATTRYIGQNRFNMLLRLIGLTLGGSLCAQTCLILTALAHIHPYQIELQKI